MYGNIIPYNAAITSEEFESFIVMHLPAHNLIEQRRIFGLSVKHTFHPVSGVSRFVGTDHLGIAQYLRVDFLNCRVFVVFILQR